MGELLLATAQLAGAPSCHQAVDQLMVEVPWAAGLLESQLESKATVRTALVHQASLPQSRRGWMGAGGWQQEEASTRRATGQFAELPELERTGSIWALHPAARYMETLFEGQRFLPLEAEGRTHSKSWTETAVAREEVLSRER